MSIISTCLVLFIFKYFNFFNDNFRSIASFLHLNYPIGIINIILPIGLSFHTFQSLSYVIEVYRGNQKAEKNFGIYSLYVMFYPQLVAGPIERPQNLLHQFYEVHYFDYSRVVSGLRLMLWGFFKKVVIADRLALVVNQVYNNPTEQNGLTFLIAAYFFAFQIYCDFSGYSDIAIGSARVIGFDLMQNFRQPYLSSSIKEFWNRWHISLSTWFKDYLYYNLVMPMRDWGKSAAVISLFLTFVISGLWHGANWTFVAWGTLHGLYLVIGVLFFKNMFQETKPIFKAFQILFIFHLVVFSLIFFRANNISDAFNIIQTIFTQLPKNIIEYLSGIPVFIGFGRYTLDVITYCFFLIILLYIIDLFISNSRFDNLFFQSKWMRWTIYFLLLYGIIFAGYFGATEFIYFQF